MQTPAYVRFPAAFDMSVIVPSGATNGLSLDHLDEESHDTAEGARAYASVEHLMPMRRDAFGVPALDAAASDFLRE
ncbi:MAG TPA: hypothetical protein VJM11_06840 [Nevskiaceae bacterium]|nr:hypothetical protein [Nevskiaceae bacterium]